MHICTKCYLTRGSYEKQKNIKHFEFLANTAFKTITINTTMNNHFMRK